MKRTKAKFFFLWRFSLSLQNSNCPKTFLCCSSFFLYKLNLYLILKIKFVFNRFFSRNSLSTLSPFLYHFIESPFTSTSLSTFKKKEILTVVHTCSKKPNFQSHHIKRNDWGKKKTTLKFFFFFFFSFPISILPSSFQALYFRRYHIVTIKVFSKPTHIPLRDTRFLSTTEKKRKIISQSPDSINNKKFFLFPFFFTTPTDIYESNSCQNDEHAQRRS